ncbi:type I 3-dehydroquinate dehydratase [Methanobrevibacter filiformis]|uniref:3-dehydroquinate dehydratase n=1 Tax=Methanobrevibacter filiformis TaxID=55758 RepID=A0A166CGH0_9EURY|nr:type I 3-dehydroquinate dehydratase [Methanobrevibacter filiformis]KZX14107.1 3-dehydroquinate dehydratase [Methanobrevibacter filiformis]
MYPDTKIAIPIFKENKEEILKTAKDYIKKGADILELRIDAITNPNPKDVESIIEEINFPTIATNRVRSEGGSFKGSEEERVNILLECCDVAKYVDIELKTDKKHIDSIVKTGVKTIISFHDFEKTPPIEKMLEIVEKEKKIGDIAKIAVMPQTLEDTLDVLAILSHFDNTIAISMGQLGSYTRVIAPKFKAPITFAASDDVTAPGQIDIETMKVLLNMNILDCDELIE